VIKFASIGMVLLLVLVAAGCGDSGPDQPVTYKITINNGWPKIVDEEEVSGSIENAWHDPVGPTIAVNTRLASETGTPMANAQLAQIQTSKLPGYRERGLKWMRVGGRPTVRWSFDMPNEQSRVEFFFEACDTAFIVRGAMGTIAYEAFARDWHMMTASIKPDCDE